MLRLSGTCVLARLTWACPPSQEIQQHLTKISKIKREKKKKKTHISCKESAVAQSSLHSLKLLFCCLSLLFPSYYSANCSKAYFFVLIFGFNYSILISINHQENQEDGTSFQINQAKDLLDHTSTTTLLF